MDIVWLIGRGAYSGRGGSTGLAIDRGYKKETGDRSALYELVQAGLALPIAVGVVLLLFWLDWQRKILYRKVLEWLAMILGQHAIFVDRDRALLLRCIGHTQR